MIVQRAIEITIEAKKSISISLKLHRIIVETIKDTIVINIVDFKLNI